MLATGDTGKTREMFLKNADEWIERVKMGKEEIPDIKRSMCV